MERRAIVLDSGALTALANRDEKIRVFIRRAVEEKATIVVPAVVLAKSTTGTSRDAAVNSVLEALSGVAPLGEAVARAAASIRFRAGRPARDTIDAIVVATADETPGTIIVSSDPNDLVALAAVRKRSHVIVM